MSQQLVLRLLLPLALIGTLCRCSDVDPWPNLGEAAKRGRIVYKTHCTACHHGDPNLAGLQGPEIVGSAPELVAARILRGDYPPGYTPKRTTKLMVPMPYLRDEVPALAAFLREAQR